MNHYPPATNTLTQPSSLRSSRKMAVVVICLAIFVDLVVYGVVMPTLPKRLKELGLQEYYVGILMAFYALGLIVITPIISIVSDRYHTRKVPMLIGLAGLILTTLLFAYSKTPVGLSLARFGQGVSGGISWTIGLSMLSDMYPSTELGSVMGYVLASNSFGFLVGPPIGGILSEYINDKAPYLFCTALAFVDLLGRLYIKPKMSAYTVVSSEDPSQSLLDPSVPTSHSRQASHAVPDNVTKSSSLSIISLVLDPQVAVTCLGIVSGATVFSGIEPTLPLYLYSTFKMSSADIGLIWIAIVIPNMVSGILAGYLSDRYGRKSVTALGLCLFAMSTPIIAYATDIVSLTFSLVFFGFSSAMVLTPALPEMAEFVEEKGGGLYAQAYALYNIAYSFGMLFGPILGGYLYSEYDFKIQQWIFAAILMMTAPILLVFWFYKVKISPLSGLTRGDTQV